MSLRDCTFVKGSNWVLSPPLPTGPECIRMLLNENDQSKQNLRTFEENFNAFHLNYHLHMEKVIHELNLANNPCCSGPDCSEVVHSAKEELREELTRDHDHLILLKEQECEGSRAEDQSSIAVLTQDLQACLTKFQELRN
ncbi:hypothetical protein HMI54_003266 [Coelomomyces lativittatus]|nr:hypothetical protein HMI54_003266 [Coelomomyces lativittatus]KAJ1518292.1 hypothetical protein HMI55_000266 [Coelomomyces lativittatus]